MAAKWRECIEDIRVPDTDTRKYRYLELLNRLKVVLISDEEAKKGAAALTVQAGETSSKNAYGAWLWFGLSGVRKRSYLLCVIWRCMQS